MLIAAASVEKGRIGLRATTLGCGGGGCSGAGVEACRGSVSGRGTGCAGAGGGTVEVLAGGSCGTEIVGGCVASGGV